jgi:hypothetical protein
MKKMLMSLLAVVLLVSVSRAQTFTTPDGAFSGTLLDGQIEQNNPYETSTNHFWQVWNSDRTESTAMGEAFEGPQSDTDAILNQVRDGALNAGAKWNARLLADNNGSYNGFHGKQFTVRLTNDNNADITFTSRVWVSETGKTIYMYTVYELTSNLPSYQNRVDWFLNTAKLPTK